MASVLRELLAGARRPIGLGGRKHHLTLGVGVQPWPGFEISGAYYRAFERFITGPLLNPAVPAGSTVTNTMHEDSFLVQFSFAPGP